MNLYNLPEPFEVTVFNRGTHEYNISTKHRQVMMLAVYSGAGGGGGFGRTTGDGGGGSGGLAGGWFTMFTPTVAVPKNLNIIVPAGGTGGLASGPGASGGPVLITSRDGSITPWLRDPITSNISAIGGIGGTVSAGGTKPNSIGMGNDTYKLFFSGLGTQSPDSAGASATGPNNTTVSNLVISNIYRPNSYGVAGGGIASGVPYDGNGIQFSSNCKYFAGTTISGGVGGTVGGAGAPGIQIPTSLNNIFPISTGGTGGGAGITGAGGAGGKGGIGSGGGGGGSGNPGGVGGSGGDGLVIFVCW